MAPITITRISMAPASAVLPAEDLARARRFYHDTLGLLGVVFESTVWPERAPAGYSKSSRSS